MAQVSAALLGGPEDGAVIALPDPNTREVLIAMPRNVVHLPRHGELPDIVVRESIGTYEATDAFTPSGDRIYIWRGVR